MLLLFLAPPVAILAPLLTRTRRYALEEWGEFAAREGEAFRLRWTEGTADAAEERPQLEDIQAAVGNVQAIRPFPFLLTDVLAFLLPLLLPALPLALLAFPLGELVGRVLDLLL
jgi:hypothetical protein